MIAAIFRNHAAEDTTSVGRNAGQPADRFKWLAILTFLIWACIIILGRLIAYDHIWGSWSPATKA